MVEEKKRKEEEEKLQEEEQKKEVSQETETTRGERSKSLVVRRSSTMLALPDLPQPPKVTVTRRADSEKNLFAPQTRARRHTCTDIREELDIPEPPKTAASPLRKNNESVKKSLFFKMFKKRKVPNDEVVHVSPLMQYKDLMAKKDLPRMRGAFNSDTTTNKEVKEVISDVERCLKKIGVKFKRSDYLWECKDKENRVWFTIELCNVANFSSMKGVKFSRNAGDTWAYKKICQELIVELKFVGKDITVN